MSPVKLQFDRSAVERLGARLREPLERMPRAMAPLVDAALEAERGRLRARSAAAVALVPARAGSTSEGRLEAKALRVTPKLLGARQTADGVVYTLYGRERLVAHAFGPEIPRLGGRVFVRRGRGRLPLRQIFAYVRAPLGAGSARRVADAMSDRVGPAVGATLAKGGA